MTDKKIALDDLVIIVNKGFKEAKTNLDDLAGMVQRGFLDVDKRFDLLEAEMNNRFERLEQIIFNEYKSRIEKLEDQIKELQSDYRQLMGMKKHI